ncbi:hypothetical protein [Streptomyces sp. AC495_CC817]|uniref:hypothetical protein n=1 Tax=Streptomyces sp. AC495_CC817 TaxID=2823900 RepID=UPI001C279658|nr:hypothetical protein [Streptomyces sp. AC495_CC817]
MITFGSEELLPSLTNIGIALAVIAVIAALVTWWGRRGGRTTFALDFTLSLSTVWALLNAVGIVFIVVKAFTVDFTEVPVSQFLLPYPSDLPCHDAGAPTTPTTTVLACGSASPDMITVYGAGGATRTFATLAQISTSLLTMTPPVLLAVICSQTLRGAAFSRVVTRTLFAGSAAVLVVGIARDLLVSIAATTALREALPPDSEWYPWGFQLTVTPLPFAASLALLALAAVFRQGIRLQQEREQLERENQRLLRDTEGLV